MASARKAPREGRPGGSPGLRLVHRVGGPSASLSTHHEGGAIACPACAAEYELKSKAETQDSQASAGSFACPSCGAEFDVTTSEPLAPIKFLEAPADSFACPSCAAELEAVVT